MKETFVIVADGAGAKVMALERRAEPATGPRYKLALKAALVNPEHTVAGRRDSRKIKSGRDRAGHIPPHGYADGRDAHEAVVIRRFAARIAGAVQPLLGQGKAAGLVVAADPRMLGYLRVVLEPMIKAGARLTELGHDYTWCTAPQLLKRLREHEVLPA